jgi:hypothetical protein
MISPEDGYAEDGGGEDVRAEGLPDRLCYLLTIDWASQPSRRHKWYFGIGPQ